MVDVFMRIVNFALPKNIQNIPAANQFHLFYNLQFCTAKRIIKIKPAVISKLLRNKYTSKMLHLNLRNVRAVILRVVVSM